MIAKVIKITLTDEQAAALLPLWELLPDGDDFGAIIGQPHRYNEIAFTALTPKQADDVQAAIGRIPPGDTITVKHPPITRHPND